MDSTTLTSQMRATTGFDAGVISDQDLSHIYTITLNEYLRFRPALQLTNTTGQITTVADQPNYDLPEDALWIDEVAWSPDGSDHSTGSDPIGQLYADIALQSYNPAHTSELLIIHQRFIDTKKYFAGAWKIINDEIWLSPCPATSGDHVAVYYAKARVLSDLASVKDQLFFELAKGHVYMRRAMDLSINSDWRAGSYAVGSGPASQMLKAAEDCLKRARHLLANSYYAERATSAMGVRSE